MNVICVDDEKLMLLSILAKLREIPDLEQIEGFRNSSDALAYIKSHPVDVAFLDIDMPDMNGLDLARAIKKLSPLTDIVFTTGYKDFALEAYTIHAVGFLLKPFSAQRLMEEIDHIKEIHGMITRRGISVQTFGEFEVYVDHQPIRFHRNKSKEILAILVDRMGQPMTNTELAVKIWPNEEYDRSKQKQMSVFLSDLRSSLDDAGAGSIFQRQRNQVFVDPSKYNCDLNQFMEGDATAIKAFRGEYMKEYWWADQTLALINKKLNR